MFKTETEKRDDARIFAGSDRAHTARGVAAITEATPALTPLMLDETTSTLVPWNGAYAGQAVAVLALDHDGVSTVCTYYKTGTFAIEVLVWPEDLDDDAKKWNAFVGTAISVA